MEVFGDTAGAHVDDDDGEETRTHSSISSRYRSRTQLFVASSTYNTRRRRVSSRRSVLLGVAAHLALVALIMCAFEGGFHPLVAHAMVVNETTGVLQRALHAVPTLAVLLALLDQSTSSFLWSLQLFVAAKIHMSALGIESGGAPDRARGVANALLALMLAAYPLHRFRRALLAQVWLVPFVAVAVAVSAMLASVDMHVMASPFVLLFNCAFLACSTLVMAAICSDNACASPPSRTRSGALAYGAVALVAQALRGSVSLSAGAFTGSLVVQLGLALLVSRELAATLHGAESVADTEDASKYLSAAEYVSINVLLTVVAAATALMAVGLAVSGVQHLVMR